MSSSPRPERPSRTAGWPLRTKLVAALVVLLAVVCAIIGVATGFALRDTLNARWDAQLGDTTTRVRRDVPPPPFPGLADPLDQPGFGPGTLVLIKHPDGGTNAERLDRGSGDRTRLSTDVTALAEAVPADGRPRTLCGSFSAWGNCSNASGQPVVCAYTRDSSGRSCRVLISFAASSGSVLTRPDGSITVVQ